MTSDKSIFTASCQWLETNWTVFFLTLITLIYDLGVGAGPSATFINLPLLMPTRTVPESSKVRIFATKNILVAYVNDPGVA